MPLNFENPPLIEVIAEFRWGNGIPFFAPNFTNAQITVDTETSINEEFFMNFGAECAIRGFQRAERISPPGFPLFPGQIAYRFRSGSTGGKQDLLQVGPGVFSCNGLPPYSWAEYRNFLILGVGALLETRPKKYEGQPFEAVSLRFINGFPERYAGSNSKIELLNKLGFALKVPPVMRRRVEGSERVSANIHYTAVIEGGDQLQVNFSEGAKDGMPIQILELGLSHVNVPADEKSILTVFDRSHEVIEEIFLDMTSGFHSIMRPRS